MSRNRRLDRWFEGAAGGIAVMAWILLSAPAATQAQGPTALAEPVELEQTPAPLIAGEKPGGGGPAAWEQPAGQPLRLPAAGGPESMAASADASAALPLAAPRDPAVVPAQVADASGQLAPESLPLGAQGVGISVQVIVPATMNLNKESSVSIVVKNTTSFDAYGVILRDVLPAGVTLVSSLPETSAPSNGVVTWLLDTLPANAERQFKLVVTPTAKGAQDHAATVQVSTGSRARTVVIQPELRVEQTVNRSTVEKGEQVQFDITVTNTGDGPAGDVLIRAELSEGLNHAVLGRILELDLNELPPRQSVRLDSLMAEAVGGGEQSCTVVVTSPDVVGDAASSENVRTVTIVEPRLQLDLLGSEVRYTDTEGEYTLTVTNPGTAAAIDVVASATLLGDGMPIVPRDAAWDPAARRLTWRIPQLKEGGGTQSFVFRVRLGGVGIFKVDGEAVARKGLRDFKSVSTSVEGNADLDLAVVGDQRILDVGQETIYRITLRNMGTKEARKLSVSAQLSPTLEALQTAGTDQNAMVDKPTMTQIAFPEIPRLAPGAEIVLAIRARAKSPGLATCRVFVSHDDLKDFGDARLEEVANAKITGSSQE